MDHERRAWTQVDTTYISEETVWDAYGGPTSPDTLEGWFVGFVTGLCRFVAGLLGCWVGGVLYRY